MLELQQIGNTSMDLEVIETVFKCGRVFGLTPNSNKNRNSNNFQKCRSCLTFTLYSLGIVTLTYLASKRFSQLTLMQTVLSFLTIINLGVFSFYVLIVVMVLNERRWFTLTDSIQSVDAGPGGKGYCWYSTTLVASLVVYFLITIIDFFAFLKYAGWVRFLLILSPHFDKYSQYLYLISACLVLKMVLTRYRHQTNMLSRLTHARLDSKELIRIMIKFKRRVLALKRSTDAFDDIFGWPILCGILSGTFRCFIYIEKSLRQNPKDLFLSELELLHFIHELSFTTTIWVNISFVIVIFIII